jgi:Fic family protein
MGYAVILQHQASSGVRRIGSAPLAPPYNEADYVPPPAEELVAALDAFEKYLHVTNSYPPLIRLALIHYQFEAIHPFLDGNGRIGRLLISLLLVDWNLLPLPLLYLSAFFEQNRKDHYRLLLAVSERGDWHEWSTFFLHGVSQQAQDAINRAKRLQDLQIEWRRQLQRPGISALLTGIADYLFMQPIISASQVQNQFDVTHPTAMKALRHLIDEGVLIDMTKAKRNQRYIAQRILAIVE